MKKIVLLIIMATLTVCSYGQSVRMGLTASPQISWMNSDASTISSNGAQFGFNFGLLTDLFFSERYSLSTGLMINNTGGELLYSDSLDFQTNDKAYNLKAGSAIKYKIQYVDIPLAFRMESNQIGYFVYYAQFGLTNHIRVGASADIEGETLADDNVTLNKVSLSGVGCKDEIDIFSMSYNIGAGINYYFSKNTAITFGLLYTNGFMDVTNNTGKNIKDNASVRNITFKIGVLF